MKPRPTLIAMCRLVVVLVLAATASAPAAETAPLQGPRIGAYYYPWYLQERWTREPVTHTPRLGHYESHDRAVAAQHIAWAREADIDFFLVSWLGPQGYEAKNFRTGVLPELERARFPFAVLYETPLALGTPAGQPIDLEALLPGGGRAGEQMVRHFQTLGTGLLTHPSYLRHEGKPVVMIYLVRDLRNAGPYLTKIRELLRAQGIELHLIADVVYWEKAEKLDWPFLREHFQAVSAYNMYHRPDFLAAVREQFAAVDIAARAAGMRLVPNVMPGYDDTRLRGAGRITIERAGGQFYRDFWSLASGFVGSDQPFLLITSFNEWHEGTELEPSAENGDVYLRLTRELAGKLRKK